VLGFDELAVSSRAHKPIRGEHTNEPSKGEQTNEINVFSFE